MNTSCQWIVLLSRYCITHVFRTGKAPKCHLLLDFGNKHGHGGRLVPEDTNIPVQPNLPRNHHGKRSHGLPMGSIVVDHFGPPIFDGVENANLRGWNLVTQANPSWRAKCGRRSGIWRLGGQTTLGVGYKAYIAHNLAIPSYQVYPPFILVFEESTKRRFYISEVHMASTLKRASPR